MDIVLVLTGVMIVRQEGCTALHLAANKGHVEIVELLLQCERVDVNVKDKVSCESRIFFCSLQLVTICFSGIWMQCFTSCSLWQAH
jgi:hypothetical protein